MLAVLAFLYSLAAYAAFGLCMIYVVAFLLGIPGFEPAPASTSPMLALLINVLLLVGFSLQHSVMARPRFKRWWTSIIPVPIERSTYVLISTMVTLLLFWTWQPLPGLLWSFDSVALQAVCWAGFALGLFILFSSSFHIDHLDLMGLRQTWVLLTGSAASSPPFLVRGLYRLVRHPIYVGWLLMFWCTPHMRTDHLLLAGAMTMYVIVAIRFEERDLVAIHGQRYSDYRREVPALVPRPSRAGRPAQREAS